MKKILSLLLIAFVAFGFAGCKIKPKVMVHVIVTDAKNNKVADQEVCMFKASIWNGGESFQKPSLKEESVKTGPDGVAEFNLGTLDLDIMGKATYCFAIFDAKENVLDYKVIDVRKGDAKEVALSTKK